MGPICIGFSFPYFSLIVCFLFFLWVMSTFAFICLVLLLDGFMSLAFICKVFLLLHIGHLIQVMNYFQKHKNIYHNLTNSITTLRLLLVKFFI
jgi:hypothetical protein